MQDNDPYSEWETVDQNSNPPSLSYDQSNESNDDFSQWETIGNAAPKVEGIGATPEQIEAHRSPFDAITRELKDFRNWFQIPLGAAKRYTYALDLANIMVQGSALAGLDELEEEFAKAGKSFDREDYLNAVLEMNQYFPTQENIERFIEEKTGLPLTPKNRLQNLIRISATAGAFGGMGSAIGAPAISIGASSAGAPDTLSDFLGLTLSQIPARQIGKNLSGKENTQNLVRNIEGQPPGGPSGPGGPGFYETAERAMQQLERAEAGNQMGPPPPPPPPPAAPQPRLIAPLPNLRGNAPSLQGRNVTQQLDQWGLKPPPANIPANISDDVGAIFSRDRFYNTTQGGQAIKNEIMNLDEQVYRGVNQRYAESRELNRDIETIHPQLVNQLMTRAEELRQIPSRSGPQQQHLSALDAILNRLATFDENGNISGYRPITNQLAIDQIQALRQKVDFDFAHGNAKNIFRPTINDIQNSVQNAANQMGSPEAAISFGEARQAYRDWVNTFDNDYIRPFRDTKNQDFSKLYKSTLDLDESNVVGNILNLSQNGQILYRGSVRDLVEKTLKPFLDNPRHVNPRQFDTSLRELRAVINPQEEQAIRETFNHYKNMPFRARPAPKQEAAAKPSKPPKEKPVESYYKGKPPEHAQKLMNTRTGIRKLREDLGKIEGGEQEFEALKYQKLRSMLRENQIEKEFTGDHLYQVLNKEKNYELFSELIGKEATEAARQEAKAIGKQTIRRENAVNLIKKSAAIKFFHTLWPVFI